MIGKKQDPAGPATSRTRPGTTPEGTSSEQEAARWVQGMFADVAPSYDLLNHILSLNIDKLWRKKTVRHVREILERPDSRAMDLCCGTGDLLVEMERAAGRPLLGSDFCFPMLVSAADKLSRNHLRSALFDADGLTLPLADNSLDLITIAFGFRNFANYRNGLRELLRVLRPGGTLAILELTQPPNAIVRTVYGAYSRHVLPLLGGLISGSRTAYTYLPSSVSKFPDATELQTWMEAEGYTRVNFHRFTFGTVALHLGRKAAA